MNHEHERRAEALHEAYVLVDTARHTLGRPDHERHVADVLADLNAALVLLRELIEQPHPERN